MAGSESDDLGNFLYGFFWVSGFEKWVVIYFLFSFSLGLDDGLFLELNLRFFPFFI